MKTKIFTICIMVAALAMFAPVAKADYKATGGGWILVDGSKASFGLQIKAECDADGQIILGIGNVQYNDRDYDIKMHSTDIEYGQFYGDPQKFVVTGSCRIQSEYYDYDYDDENVIFHLTGGEDEFGITIWILDEDDLYRQLYSSAEWGSSYIWPVPLDGGNIKIQVK